MSIAFGSLLRRTVLPGLVAASLATCSGPMTPPASIDDETTVSAISPREQETQDASYAAPVEAAQTAADSDVLDTPVLAATDSQPLPKIDEEPALPKIDDEQAQPLNQITVPENGVNMDAALGLETPQTDPNRPVGLAEEQAADIAEGQTDQPVVDGIGTDTLVERQPRTVATRKTVDFSDATSVDQITPPTRQSRAAEETQVAMLPRPVNPLDEPEPQVELSAGDRACLAELSRMGVKFEQMEPINDSRSCGITHPIKVTGFYGGIQLKPAATLNCPMTKMFAKWVKNELVPSARYRYFSGVKTIQQMSSYSCRKMNSRSNNPWSEHARGNALDIGGFTLKNGKHIDVRKKSFFAFREKGLLKTVRTDSCKYFKTVLGPGDPYHGDHFHFDLRQRRKGNVYCSL